MNLLIKVKLFCLWQNLSQTGIGDIYLFLKKSPSICHMTEGQQRKRVEAQRCDLINRFSNKARK